MTNACPGTDLLLLLKESLIEDEDNARELDWHLSGCERCQARLELVEDSLEPPKLPPLPEGLYGRLEKRIRHEGRSQAQPTAATLGVKMLCSVCKGGLARGEAVYCSACLAPYHDDCFSDHGRCAALGCEETRVVRSADGVRKKRGGSVWGRAALILAVGAGSGLAAAYAWRLTDTGPGPAAPTAVTAPEMRVESYDVAGLLPATQKAPVGYGLSLEEALADDLPELEEGWRRDMVRILRTRRISVNFKDTPFADVLTFMQDITGLNLVAEADVTVSDLRAEISLRNTDLGEALLSMAEQAKLAMTLRNGCLYIHKPRDRAWPGDLGDSLRALEGREKWSDEALLEALRERLAPPAAGSFLTIREGLLIARQPVEVQARIPALLNDLASPKQGPTARWLDPLSRAPRDPSLEDIEAAVARLRERRVNLNFDQTKVTEVVSFLRTVDPELPALRFDEPEMDVREVSLKVRQVTLLNALTLLTEQLGLAVDVDRRGILVRRPTAMPLERRLRDRGRAVLDAGSADTALRRRLDHQRVDLDFKDTPFEDVLGILRAITGLNFVIDAEARAKTPSVVTFQGRSMTLRSALAALLGPHGLGIRLRGGVVHLSLIGRANLIAGFDGRLSALLERPWPRYGTGINLADFARQLGDVTEAEVVFPDGLRERRRLAIPEGMKVGEALELARLQTGLNWGLAWAEDQRPLFALARRPDGLFERADAALPAAPTSLGDQYAETQGRLTAALADLAKPDAHQRLPALLDELRAAVERAEDQLSYDAAVTRAVRSRGSVGEAEAEAARLEEGIIFDHRVTERELHLKSVAMMRSAPEDEAEVVRARAALEAARAAEARGAEAGALEREYKEVLNRAMARKTRAEKVLKVEYAKNRSKAREVKDRAAKLRGASFVAGELLKRQAALDAGGAWDSVFPEGFARWRARATAAAEEEAWEDCEARVERRFTEFKAEEGEAK